MNTARKDSNHAIVIGASVAGLLAARVLSDHFERVTILEKDHFPAPGENRKGVPQGRHAHGLLAGGFRAMNALLPGLKDDLVQAGALVGDMTGEFRWYQFDCYKARFQSGLKGIFLSRPLLEATIRRRVLALSNIEVLEGCSVRELLAGPDRRRVTGVRLQRKDGGEEEREADLVLDASGRGSRSPAWLEALGYARPEEETISIGMGYTSRIYRRRPEDLGGDRGILIASTPPHGKRMSALLAIEGDRWHVSFGGFFGDHAPAEEEGFLAFARSLPVPDIYDVIRRAEPLSSFMVHKFPSNLRRRYEYLARFPEGYLVVGDAVCSFNPIYGQGMSVAAMEALALRDCLEAQRRAGSLTGLHRRFFKRAAGVIDIPWGLAAGADFAYPEAEGKRPVGAGLVNRYMARLQQVASYDPTIFRAFIDVINLLEPPTHLFKPGIVFRVLRGRWNGRPAPAPVGAVAPAWAEA